MNVLLAAIFGYLVGSIAFAVVFSKVFGLPDPRTYGSGNPGATNVLRSGKRSAALLTLLGDAAKGALTVWIVRWLGWSEPAIAAAGLAAFVGHLWPLYFGFKGGKGVATAFGIVLALSPLLAGITLAIFVLAVATSRYVSLASVLSGVGASFAALALYGMGPTSGAVILMAVLIVIRHRANLSRLVAGSESRLGAKRTIQPTAPTTPADPSAAER